MADVSVAAEQCSRGIMMERLAMLSDVNIEIDEIMPGVIADRRYLHQHPELGYELHETAAFVRQRLEDLGVDDIRTGIVETGITALIRGTKSGPGKCALFRADMDALPILEEGESDYVSLNKGRMHACGHDTHTAMLLAAARVLMNNRDKFSGTVKLLFQPSEEDFPGGAKPMIDAGVLEDPYVDAVFGQHIFTPSPLGEVHVQDGPALAAADSFTISIQGRGGHGGIPHETVDPIMIAAHILTAIQTIVSRGTDPLKAAVISVGSIHSGSANNVIPDSCTITGTVRTYNSEVRDKAERRIAEIARNTATSLEGSAEVEYQRGYPATVNNAEMASLVREAANEAEVPVVNRGAPVTGSEDFGYFLNERPGAFWMVGCRNEEKDIVWPHHHPKFDIDEEAMSYGVKTMVNVAFKYLNQA